MMLMSDMMWYTQFPRRLRNGLDLISSDTKKHSGLGRARAESREQKKVIRNGNWM